MKENKEKTYLKEVIIGFILSILSILVFISAIIIINYNPIEDLSSSWYLFLLLALGIILFIAGFIFLKKFNKKRLDYLLKKDDNTKEFEELINKRIKEAKEAKENDIKK